MEVEEEGGEEAEGEESIYRSYNEANLIKDLRKMDQPNLCLFMGYFCSFRTTFYIKIDFNGIRTLIDGVEGQRNDDH